MIHLSVDGDEDEEDDDEEEDAEEVDLESDFFFSVFSPEASSFLAVSDPDGSPLLDFFA